MNKINYELSLWEESIVVQERPINNVDELIIGQTYYFSTEEDPRVRCGYCINLSIDKSLCLFRSYGEIENDRNIQIKNSQLSQFVKEKVNVYNEEKVAILSENSMTFEGRARNCIFTSKLRSNELTFDIPHKYFDTYKQQFIKNPLIDKIKEDSLIKLRLETEWYDLRVKEIVETRENAVKLYRYRCVDSFIEELSKQGWTLTFTEDNGIGTIDELVPKILNGTEWKYIPVYSSDTESENDPFLERQTKIKLDENNKVVYDDNGFPVEVEEIKKQEKLIWNSAVGKMVYTYEQPILIEDQTYDFYSYDTITKVDIEACQNLLMNTKNFVNADYWQGDDNNTIEPYYSENENLMKNRLSLSIKNTVNDIYSFSQTSGTFNKTLYADKYYAFSALMRYNSLNYKECEITIYDDNDDENDKVKWSTTWKEDPNNIKNFNNFLEKNYLIIHPSKNINNFTIKVKLINDEPNDAENKYLYIDNIELFELIPTKKFKENESFSFPKDGTLLSKEYFTAQDKDEQHYLLPEQVTLIEPYQFLTTKYFYEINGEPYYINEETIKTTDHKEKLKTSRKNRTLIASQSNRLSLLDSVAELFEGYPKFTVKHEENGKIKYKNGRPEKYVTFKEFLIQENSNVLFSYGNNLNNITRTKVTDELITKLYVNNHETNGNLISIMDSQYNPIGENYLLDLGYYVKIDRYIRSEYYNDLYGMENGLNYIDNLYKYNQKYTELSQENSVYLQNIMSLKEQKRLLELQIKECDDIIAETASEAEATEYLES